MEKRYEFRP